MNKSWKNRESVAEVKTEEVKKKNKSIHDRPIIPVGYHGCNPELRRKIEQLEQEREIKNQYDIGYPDL
ncbi:MAG: hypothetical protein ACR2MX_01640 [Cyclobacteriaceae bacterium]